MGYPAVVLAAPLKISNPSLFNLITLLLIVVRLPEIEYVKSLVMLLLQVLSLVALVAYFVIALRRVYQPTWFAVAWKSFVVIFAYMMIVSIAIENTSDFLVIGD